MSSAVGAAAPAPAGSPEPRADAPAGRAERAVAAVERQWAWALAAIVLADAVLLLYMGRELSFFYDEWDFVTHDYGGGLHSLLVAHVGNISVFPVAVYKVLFHLAGLDHYAVYRLVLLGLHLLAGALVFALASRRVGHTRALLAAALILFLGAAWEDLLWPFQIGYMLSIVGGLAAWVLLERRDTAGDVAVMLALIVAVGSSSLGIPLVIGVACELAWGRWWRRSWIVIVPALLYLLWYAGYGESEVTKASLIAAPGFAADLAAAAFGGLAGRGLDWGRPLAIAGIALAIVAIARKRAASGRLVGLLAAGLALWAVTAAARSTISSPEASRYIYLGAVVIVLAAVELLDGVPIGAAATVAAGAFVAVFVITGLTVLHNGAAGLRSTSRTVTAELGALQLAAGRAPATFQPDPQRAPQIQAGPYLHTVRAIGSSPADTPAAIAAADPASRAAADRVLIALDAPALQAVPARPSAPLAPAPAVLAISGAAQAGAGPCARLTPLGRAPAGAVIELPAGGVAISSPHPIAPTLALRRFGEAFTPVGAPAPGGHWKLVLPTDGAGVPWQLSVSFSSPLSVCGLHP